MSKITDALAKLDPANDNHWTSDGLPRIDTVRMLAADQTLSRELITSEAPDFSRQNPILGVAGAGAIAPVVATVLAPIAPDAAVAGVAPVITTIEEHLAANPMTAAEYDALIQRGQEALQSAIDERNAAQEKLNQTQNQLDAVINAKHDAGVGDNTMDTIQGYLASQQAVLAERGRRSQVLKDSGVTLSDIKSLLPQPSELDRALASKKR